MLRSPLPSRLDLEDVQEFLGDFVGERLFVEVFLGKGESVGVFARESPGEFPYVCA